LESICNRNSTTTIGFISANLHKSFDKTRVANYAQCKRKNGVETMFMVPDAKGYFNQMSEISIQNWVYIESFIHPISLLID
jgi:hypothetical protein